MKFDDFDRRMRLYETAHDHCVLPGIRIVVRLDGRGFTRLTRELHPFKAPFDEDFRDLMTRTVRHLMECGIACRFGYTQSDEISLLLEDEADAFKRKEHKLISILAGEASACFTLQMGRVVAFDARVCQLPDFATVVEYFRWRSTDAARNALGSHCYWMLRKQGLGPSAAQARLDGLREVAKHDVLSAGGINFNDLPAWQKRGVGLYWGDEVRSGLDPRTGTEVLATRKVLVEDGSLPVGDAWEGYLLDRTPH